MRGMFDRGLVVSLTPSAHSPWREPYDIARLAVSAEAGGAVAVKVDGPSAVRAARAATSLPVCAVWIDYDHPSGISITPTVRHAQELADAGADIIEIEADGQARRAAGQDVPQLIGELLALGVPVKAGVQTVADGLVAQDAGASIVGSSTSGYGTGAPAAATLPDLGLARDLVRALRVPVTAERGYSDVDVVRRAFELGVHAVVVGSAITDPFFLTMRFAEAAGRHR